MSPVSLRGEKPSEAQPGVDPLALKQEMIRDRYKRFEDRVFRLREQLESTEPANAERLGRVLERAGEAGLADQLEQLIALLRDPSALNNAIDDQAKWLEDADRLLGILLEQDGQNKDRRDEMDRLKAYQEKLEKILEEQKALRDDAAQTASTRRLAQQLDQAIRRVDALLGKQGQLSEASQGADSPAPQLAERQQQTGHESEELAEDVEKLAQPPAETQDTEAMKKAREQSAAAAGELRKSGASMSKAGQSLQSGSPSSASPAQKEATDALKKAKEKLEAAKKELQAQNNSKEQASKQRETSGQTKGLSDQMRQDAAQQGGGKKSGGKSGSSTPGLQNLDQAEQEMDHAAESLEKDAPDGAAPHQDRALQELEQAQRELENALQQLRKEERAEMLRDLESRFRDMLDKQRAINTETVRLAEIGREKFGRAESLQLADLATKQRLVSDQAGVCGHILEEDGTTIVFPRILDQVAQDMRRVGDRLVDADVGLLTQTMEQEIVDALEQLLDAVKRMQEENERGGGGKGGGGGKENQPLLPSSAEYKLLKSAQLRVNTRTTAIETARRDGSEPTEKLADVLRATAERQKECKGIASEMRDRRKD